MPVRFRALLPGLTVLAMASAATAAPRLQPLYVVGGAPTEIAEAQAAPARAAFARATAAAGLPAPELVAIAGGPTPRAREQLQAAERALAELRFDDAQSALSAAVAEVAITGGAGLNAGELDDLFLLRGVAALRAGEPSRARAWDDLLHAALLAPERVLDAGRFAPAVTDTWRRATAEAQRRPRGVLVVRAGAGAQIVVDGRPAVASPAALPGVAYGEHYVRVEEAGRLPWATLAVLAAPTLEVEVPARARLGLDDRAAAEKGAARRADYALVAEPAPSTASEPLLELTLVRVADAGRRDERLVRVDADGGSVTRAVAAILALARTEAAPPLLAISAPAAAPAPARRTWPYWVAGAALLVGIGVAAAILASGSDGGGSGFSATLNPNGLGK